VEFGGTLRVAQLAEEGWFILRWIILSVAMAMHLIDIIRGMSNKSIVNTENAEVLQYVCDNFVDRPNVTFIEGNHDGYIWQWLNRQYDVIISFTSAGCMTVYRFGMAHVER